MPLHFQMQHKYSDNHTLLIFLLFLNFFTNYTICRQYEPHHACVAFVTPRVTAITAKAAANVHATSPGFSL